MFSRQTALVGLTLLAQGCGTAGPSRHGAAAGHQNAPTVGIESELTVDSAGLALGDFDQVLTGYTLRVVQCDTTGPHDGKDIKFEDRKTARIVSSLTNVRIYPSELNVKIAGASVVLTPVEKVGSNECSYFGNHKVAGLQDYAVKGAVGTDRIIASVKLVNGVDATEMGTGASKTVSVAFDAALEVVAGAKVKLPIGAASRKLEETVTGVTPPALSLVDGSIADASPLDNAECIFTAQLKCTKAPVYDATAKVLTSCDGTPLTSLPWTLSEIEEKGGKWKVQAQSVAVPTLAKAATVAADTVQLSFKFKCLRGDVGTSEEKDLALRLSVENRSGCDAAHSAAGLCGRTSVEMTLDLNYNR